MQFEAKPCTDKIATGALPLVTKIYRGFTGFLSYSHNLAIRRPCQRRLVLITLVNAPQITNCLADSQTLLQASLVSLTGRREREVLMRLAEFQQTSD